MELGPIIIREPDILNQDTVELGSATLQARLGITTATLPGRIVVRRLLLQFSALRKQVVLDVCRVVQEYQGRVIDTTVLGESFPCYVDMPDLPIACDHDSCAYDLSLVLYRTRVYSYLLLEDDTYLLDEAGQPLLLEESI
jgi:hypothetical protein